jgi:hypothetical protein
VIAWLRLWAPQLTVAGLAVLLVPGRLRATPTVPVDAGWDAWSQGLVWPSGETIAAHLAVVAVVFFLVTVADFTVGRRWRRARTLRWRWERSAATRDAALRRIRMGNGTATATVSIRSGDWEKLTAALDLNRGQALRTLRLDRAWGSPVRAHLSTVGYRNPARSRKLRLNYLPLGDPWKLPTYEQPAQGAKLMVGYSYDGPLFVDLEIVPHTRVVGPTGSGKGFFIRLLEVQALRAGWLGIVLDGGNSPEHAFIDGAATFQRPMRAGMTPAERLSAALAALETVRRVINLRSSLCELFGESRWADLPADVRRWQPRVVLIVDEVTALLANSKDEHLDRLRAQLRGALDSDVLRTGRKFGVNVLPLSDQFAYSGVIPKAASWQAEGVVVLGNLAPEHIKQATGLAGLPPVPDDLGLCGHFVRVGNPNPKELRVPPNDQRTLQRAVAFVRGEGQ